MSDKELLEICRQAFEATRDPRNARAMLRELDPENAKFTMGGSETLAVTMSRMINEHLKGGL